AAFIDLIRYFHIEYDVAGTGPKREKWRPHCVAFVLLRDRPAVRVELKEAAVIEEAAAAWCRAITATRPDEKAERAAAARLAGLVWKPLRDALPADVSTVYLAPEGKLSQVPWGALPGAAAGAVLLDECVVCLVPHGAFLLERLQG